MTLAVYWLCVAVLLSCNVLVQSEITTLYPTDPQDWSLFPYGAGDVELADVNLLSSLVDGLNHNIIIHGTTYDEAYIESNGYVLLRDENDPSKRTFIEPFLSNINFEQYTPGFHSYRVDTTPEILARATDAVMAIRQYAQEIPDFQATWTLVATWHDAVQHGSSSDADKNTFQSVLACDDAHTFAIFNYGHQMESSFGDETFVGYEINNGVFYLLPGSESTTIHDIVRNKRLIFRLDPPTFALPLCVPGTMSESGNALMGPCNECLVGFYQSDAGSENCMACPSGETTPNTGSDSLDDCYTPGSSVLDPHFMITNPKTGERFCFNYGGKERDVLNLVHDEKAELSGILFEVGPTEEKVTYFANILIGTSAGTRLNFTKYEITVGDEELSWDMEDIYVGDDVVIRPLDERAQAMLVELDGGDIGVVVTRHHDDIGYYLGVYLSNTEGLSSDSEGLLGQFIHNDFEVDVPNSLVTWHLSRGDIVVPVEQKERFNPAAHDNQMCWVYLTEDEDNELFTAAITHTRTHARNAFLGGV